MLERLDVAAHPVSCLMAFLFSDSLPQQNR